MKNEYLKPDVERILFRINENLMDEEDDDDIVDGELGASGEFDF